MRWILEYPRAILDGSKDTVGLGHKLDGYEALGGIRFEKISLKSGEEKTFIIILGYGSSKEDIEKTAKKYRSEKASMKAFEVTKAYWEDKVNVSYNSGSKDFMHGCNVNFQPILRRIYGCSFLPHHDYGRVVADGRLMAGDCLAFIIMNPSGVGICY